MTGEGIAESGERINRVACHQCGHLVDVSAAEAFSTVTCPQCQARLCVPVKLGHFLLLQVLGKGTVGAVYKALDRELGRHVAIKVVHDSLAQDEQVAAQFLGEARALAALKHPNVVGIYSLGNEGGRPYIVMQLVSGGSLRSLISRDKPLDEVRALEIAVGVAEGLKAAHGIGLIHGDVKPANVLLSEKGVPKLVDFGLARFGGVRQDPNEGMGTPYYVAPERVRQRDADHRSDIYSLGATLFHVLAGQPAFGGRTVKDVLFAQLRMLAPDVRVLRPSLHPQTGAALAKMLQKDRDNRHQTYDELLADLRAALEAAKAKPPGSELDELWQSVQASRQQGPTYSGAEAATAGQEKAAAEATQRRTPSKMRDVTVLAVVVLALILVAVGAVGAYYLWASNSGGADARHPAESDIYPTAKPTPGDGTSGQQPAPRDSPREDALTPQSPPRADVKDDASTRLEGVDYGARPKPRDQGDGEEKKQPPASPTVRQQGDGSLLLHARDAAIHGNTIRYEVGNGKDNIGSWMGANNSVTWDFEITKPGEFLVELTFACPGDSAGGAFTIAVEEERLTGKVESTGSWTAFTTKEIGTIKLSKACNYTLEVTGSPKRRRALINLQSIRFKPR